MQKHYAQLQLWRGVFRMPIRYAERSVSDVQKTRNNIRGGITMKCIRWCQRCGGDICYTMDGDVICYDCPAKNAELFDIVESDE